MRRSRRRIGPRLRVLLGLAVGAQILTGGIAGATGDSQSLQFTVQSQRSITVAADIGGDEGAIRQTDVLTGLSGAITGYVGASTTDEVAVNRTSLDVPIGADEDAVRIYVLASGLACPGCDPDAATPETAGSAVDGVPGGELDPVEITRDPTSYSTIISGINTGAATGTAVLTYTVVTTQAVVGTYTYTLTYVIRAAT